MIGMNENTTIGTEDIKNNIARNIASGRKSLGLTQLQLAEKLNYSDKAVSKWERGEAVPDIYIMHELAVLFGTTVDSLIGAEPAPKVKRPIFSAKRNKVVISLLSVGLVWLVATVLYVILRWANVKEKVWLTFVYALPISSVVAIVFNALWGKRIITTVLVSVLIWSIALTVMLTFELSEIWLIFIVGVPLQILTIIWYFLKRNNAGKQV